MADPVSWLMIEPGWRVHAADGTEVGRVEEVTGDSNADIFDGLAVAFSAHGHQHYVPSEQVGTITTGVVQLTLSPADIASLGEFLEPAESEQIEPEKASFAARIDTKVTGPKPTAHRNHPLRRMLEWFGLAGKR